MTVKKPRSGVLLRCFVLTGMLFSAFSGTAFAQVSHPCDEEVAALKKEFITLRNTRKANPGSVTSEVFRDAARRYIEAGETCYIQKYGAFDTPNKFDDGGLYAPGFGPSEAPEGSAEYNTGGLKWGPNSPYSPSGQDIPGPGTAGGTVTWSLMGNGITINEGPVYTSTAITSLATYAPCFLTEIQTAFDAWAAAADITFVQVTDSGHAFDAAGAAGDIRIAGHVFDGPSGVLAHGYYPPPNGTSAAGDLHFDIAENWTCDSGPGQIDFGTVTAHEIGHNIGLGHEPTPPSGDLALMNPFYNPALAGPIADDIEGAESIYGMVSVLFNLVLYTDWERDSTYTSSPLALYDNFTFTAGADSGIYEFGPGPTLSFVFHTGCAPLYSGVVYGFMKCTDGSQTPSALPGYYYWNFPPPLQEPSGDDGSGGSAGSPPQN